MIHIENIYNVLLYGSMYLKHEVSEIVPVPVTLSLVRLVANSYRLIMSQFKVQVYMVEQISSQYGVHKR